MSGGPAPRRAIDSPLVQDEAAAPAPPKPLRVPVRRFVPPVVYECVVCGKAVVQLYTQGPEADPVMQWGLCQEHHRQWNATPAGAEELIAFIRPLQAQLAAGQFMRGLVVYREPGGGDG